MVVDGGGERNTAITATKVDREVGTTKHDKEMVS